MRHPHGANPKSGRRFSASALVVLRAAAGLLLLSPALSGAAPRPNPRDPLHIAEILASGAHAGDCQSCHTQHAEGQPEPKEHALIGPDDNSLCDRCHTSPWTTGSYAGTWTYAGSAHGSSPAMAWPGPDPPARTDAPGKCLECHDPHGWEDAGGVMPKLEVGREENLCLACHDGSPAATNVRADLLKPFRHPTADYSGRHTGADESSPQDFAISPVNRRHAECEDCHNAHVARGDGLAPPPAPEASKRLLGVSRVSVLNGGAGSVPGYTFRAGSDTLSAPVAEYQLCFKCHSSWTVQPAGQTDLARALNPSNPSFHPVERSGADPGISPFSFVAGWSSSSLTRCGDCHGSDMGAAGPHGSTNRYILKRPYTASSATRAMMSDESCFECHQYAVYADPGAVASHTATRFSTTAGGGHADHVGTYAVPCYACHVTHGSTTQPHLISTDHVPGITSFSQTATEGTCASTCHPEARTYTISYGR